MGSRLGSATKARGALRDRANSNMYDLMNLELPVISLVDGAAAGAGANIALAADFVLATPARLPDAGFREDRPSTGLGRNVHPAVA